MIAGCHTYLEGGRSGSPRAKGRGGKKQGGKGKCFGALFKVRLRTTNVGFCFLGVHGYLSSPTGFFPRYMWLDKQAWLVKEKWLGRQGQGHLRGSLFLAGNYSKTGQNKSWWWIKIDTKYYDQFCFLESLSFMSFI